MKVEYSDVPATIQAVVSPRIDQFVRLFPGWCEKLTVYWDKKDGDETILTCTPRYEYRTMGITIYPLFLEVTDWENALIHEIQHSLLRPYVAMVEQIVDTFLKNGDTEYIYAVLNQAEEAVCEDLTIFAEKLCRCTNTNVRSAVTEVTSYSNEKINPNLLNVLNARDEQ